MKKYIIFIIFIFLCSFCYGFSYPAYSIDSFSGESNPLNFLLLYNVSQTYYLSFPLYTLANVINMSITKPKEIFHLQDDNNTAQNFGTILVGQAIRGNNFTFNRSFKLAAVEVYIKYTDLPLGKTWASIYNSVNGLPQTLLYNSSFVLNSSINQTFRPLNYTFNNVELNASTYFIIFNSENPIETANYYSLQALAMLPAGINDTADIRTSNISNGWLFDVGRAMRIKIYAATNLGINVSNLTNYNISSSNFTLSVDKSIINGILNTSCACHNCLISSSDCLIPFTFYSNETIGLTINLTAVNHSYGIDNCSIFGYRILNFTYFDAKSLLPIAPKNTYDLLFTGLFTQSLQGSFTNHNVDSFCTNINITERNLEYDVTGQVTLTEDEYTTKIYDFAAGINIPASLVTQPLYMIKLNESTTMVITWLTTNYEAIDGTMLVYKCNGDGTRTLLDSTAIINGDSVTNVELINTPYSYEVIVNGVTYTDAEGYTKCHVETAETRQFLVQISQQNTTQIIGLYSIPCNITKLNNVTAKMEFGYNPKSTAVITGCIEAYRNTVTGTVQVFQNCSSTSHSFTITVPSSSYAYTVKGKLYQGGYSIECKDSVEFYTNVESGRKFGLMGLLSVFFLICAFILWQSDNSLNQHLGAIGGLLTAFILGLFAFTWTTLAALIFFDIFIMLISRYSRAPT